MRRLIDPTTRAPAASVRKMSCEADLVVALAGTTPQLAFR